MTAWLASLTLLALAAAVIGFGGLAGVASGLVKALSVLTLLLAGLMRRARRPAKVRVAAKEKPGPEPPL
jgi:uncharacterized membrane protein YtjA (UPF0391 family)